MNRPSEAIENLKQYQQQVDEEGVRVAVSRQALDETLAYLAAAEECLVDTFHPETGYVIELENTIAELETKLCECK